MLIRWWPALVFMVVLVTLCGNVQSSSLTFINISSSCILQSTNSFDGGFLTLNSTTTCNCTGTPFPPWLLNFTNTPNLSLINIPNCNFEGKILSYMNLSALIYLDLQGNRFQESIPDSIFKGTLEVLNVASNQFYGVIPDFSNLNMKVFVLANNSLTGQFQRVVPFSSYNLNYSIAGNRFYIDTSNLKFNTPPGGPLYWKNDGRAKLNNLTMFECIYVLKGAAFRLPAWCNATDLSNVTRCTCVPQCGNGFVEDGEDCDPTDLDQAPCCNSTCHFLPIGSTCGPQAPCAISQCNSSHVCDWRLVDPGVLCRISSGVCDLPSYCGTSGPDCPPNLFQNHWYPCRSANGSCDIQENCTGNSSTCPSNGYQSADVICRSQSGDCDAPEYCSGKSSECPDDDKYPSSHVCRPVNGSCDIAEHCDGGYQCPADAYEAFATVCNPQTCYISLCGGNNGICPAPQAVVCAQNGFCNSTGNCTCQNPLMTYPNCMSCGDTQCLDLEDCYNCPVDCPCAQTCGDTICDSNETCSSCEIDCAMKCTPCDPPCIHGTCMDAKCSCDPTFTGPSCSNSSLPINVHNNDTSPAVDLHAIGLDNAMFTISLKQIHEEDSAGVIRNVVNLTSVDFILKTTTTANYSFWNYSTALFQQTILHIYIFHFTNTINFNFSGNDTRVDANTLKLAVFISNWPFRGTRSSLFVTFDNTIFDVEQLHPCAYKSGRNSDASLRWYKLTTNGVSLYAQMEDSAILDGFTKPITFASSSPTTVSAKIPFFWYNLTLDPNFSVILEDSDPCAESFTKSLRGSWNMLYIIPIVVVCVACALLLWKYDKLRSWARMIRKPRVVVEMDETGHTTSASIDLD